MLKLLRSPQHQSGGTLGLCLRATSHSFSKAAGRFPYQELFVHVHAGAVRGGYLLQHNSVALRGEETALRAASSPNTPQRLLMPFVTGWISLPCFGALRVCANISIYARMKLCTGMHCSTGIAAARSSSIGMGRRL
jgi:hypothetical protein